jgi:TRAP-type C4-dicarboxylate transport system permease small subunit
METVFALMKKLSRLMFWIACGAILSIVFLTTSDVIMRRFGNPIDFTFEVVVFLGAILIGFSIPQATLNKRHVLMEFVIEKLPKKYRRILSVITRCLGIGLFIIIGSSIIVMGNYLTKSGQVSAILEIPDYPVAYGIGICCLIECVVLFYDLLQQLKGEKT